MKAALLTSSLAIISVAAVSQAAPEPVLRDGPSVESFANSRSLEMSPAHALVLAEQLFNRGELDAAAEILTALGQAKDDALDQTQIQFLTGMIAASRGNFRVAENTFREILDDRPEICLLYTSDAADE